MSEENINLNEEKIAEEIECQESLAEEIPTEQEAFTEENEEQPIVFSMLKPTKKQLEKTEIKRMGRVAGISFLIFYAVMWILNIVTILIARIFNSSYNETLNLLYEPALQQVQQIFFSISVFTVPFILVFKLFKFRISDLISFKKPTGKKSLYLFLIGISFCAFSNIASSMAEQIFDRAGISYEVDFGDSPEGFFGFMLSFLATAIAPALAEEFACRGILLGALKKYGEAFAVIVSSLLFGLMHANFEQIPFAFLAGLVLAYITVKSESIWIAVAVHCFNNSISIVYTYVLSGLSGVAQNISYTVLLIACMLLGLFAVTKLSGEKDIFHFAEDTATTSLSERIKWFLLSVPIILFIAICIIQSLMYFV